MRKSCHSLLLTLCVCLPRQARKDQSMKTLESQRAQLEKEIATLNRQLAQNSKNSSEAMTSLTLVRSKISAREKLIAGCDQTLRIQGPQEIPAAAAGEEPPEGGAEPQDCRPHPAAATEAAARPRAAGKKAGAKTTSTAIDTKLSNEFAANKGRLPWPVEGAIIERFGKHKHPVYQNVDLPHNNGVTLAVKRGAQAKAVFNGTVTQIVVLPGYNQCVLVNHGAYFTLYSKLKSVAVKVGQKVTTGQVVGTVDTIGGEDLFHFELWKGSTPQNPESWLRQ